MQEGHCVTRVKSQGRLIYKSGTMFSQKVRICHFSEAGCFMKILTRAKYRHYYVQSDCSVLQLLQQPLIRFVAY